MNRGAACLVAGYRMPSGRCYVLTLGALGIGTQPSVPPQSTSGCVPTDRIHQRWSSQTGVPSSHEGSKTQYTLRYIPRSYKPGTPQTEVEGFWCVERGFRRFWPFGESWLLSDGGRPPPDDPRLPPRSLSNHKSGSTEITHLRYMTRTSSMLQYAYRRTGRPSYPLRGRRPGFSTGF